MAKHTSISLGDHFEQFVSGKVAGGRFGSASEVIRAALRLMEREESEEQAKMEALRGAIRKGMGSGRADYSLEKLNARLDRERR